MILNMWLESLVSIENSTRKGIKIWTSTHGNRSHDDTLFNLGCGVIVFTRQKKKKKENEVIR